MSICQLSNHNPNPNHTHITRCLRMGSRIHCAVGPPIQADPLTLDPKVVSVSEVLLGQPRPLLRDLAHRLGAIRRENLQERVCVGRWEGNGVAVVITLCRALYLVWEKLVSLKVRPLYSSTDYNSVIWWTIIKRNVMCYVCIYIYRIIFVHFSYCPLTCLHEQSDAGHQLGKLILMPFLSHGLCTNEAENTVVFLCKQQNVVINTAGCLFQSYQQKKAFCVPPNPNLIVHKIDSLKKTTQFVPLLTRSVQVFFSRSFSLSRTLKHTPVSVLLGC